MPKFTPTEQRIVDALSDGMPHASTNLVKCVDELADDRTLRVHLSRIRKKITPIGQDILPLSIDGVLLYRHVRVISINE